MMSYFPEGEEEQQSCAVWKEAQLAREDARANATCHAAAPGIGQNSFAPVSREAGRHKEDC